MILIVDDQKDTGTALHVSPESVNVRAKRKGANESLLRGGSLACHRLPFNRNVEHVGIQSHAAGAPDRHSIA